MAELTRTPRTTLLIGISAVIVIAQAFANGIVARSATDDHSVAGWIGFSIFGIALTAVLVLVAVPRIPDEHRRTAVLAFGGGAIVFCLLFYTGIPFALGAAALAAAGPSDDSVRGKKPAPTTAGVLLALLAIVGCFVFCIAG
jgi:hypothetical protein